MTMTVPLPMTLGMILGKPTACLTYSIEGRSCVSSTNFSKLKYLRRLTDEWITNLEEEHKKDTWAKDFQTKVTADKNELLETLSKRLEAQ